MMLPEFQSGIELAHAFAAHEQKKKNIESRQKGNKQEGSRKSISGRTTKSGSRSDRSVGSDRSSKKSISSLLEKSNSSDLSCSLTESSVGGADEYEWGSSSTLPSMKAGQKLSPDATLAAALLLSESSKEKQDLPIEIQDSLLKQLKVRQQELAQQEELIQNSMPVHLDRARARYNSQNKKGALISLRRIQQEQMELATLKEAQAFLASQREQLQNQIKQAVTEPSFQSTPGRPSKLLKRLVKNSIDDCMTKVNTMLKKSPASSSLASFLHNSPRCNESQIIEEDEKTPAGADASQSVEKESQLSVYKSDEQLLEEFAKTLKNESGGPCSI